MRVTGIVVALVVGVAAWGIHVARQGSDEEPATSEEAPAPIDPSSPGTSMPRGFFDEVFFDDGRAKAPVLRGPLRHVLLGAAVDDVFAKSPELAQAYANGLPGYEDAKPGFISDHAERLYLFKLSFPDDGQALEAMTEQWGPPMGVDRETAHYWHNRETNLMVVLHSSPVWAESTVDMLVARRLPAFFGSGGLLGFEQSDTLGRPGTEIDGTLDAEEGIVRHYIDMFEGSTLGLSAEYHLDERDLVERIVVATRLLGPHGPILEHLDGIYPDTLVANEDDLRLQRSYRDRLGRRVDALISLQDDRAVITISR